MHVLTLRTPRANATKAAVVSEPTGVSFRQQEIGGTFG